MLLPLIVCPSYGSVYNSSDLAIAQVFKKSPASIQSCQEDNGSIGSVNRQRSGRVSVKRPSRFHDRSACLSIPQVCSGSASVTRADGASRRNHAPFAFTTLFVPLMPKPSAGRRRQHARARLLPVTRDRLDLRFDDRFLRRAVPRRRLR